MTKKEYVEYGKQKHIHIEMDRRTHKQNHQYELNLSTKDRYTDGIRQLN